jgi:hypothetical protein
MSALPPKAAIETGPVISFDNSGSFAMLTAIRRASDSKVICAII